MQDAITLAALMLALNGWMQTLKAGDLAPTLPAAN
jgi:hypothetical protein